MHLLLLISDESNTNTDDHGNFQETFMKQFQNFVTPLLVMGLFLASFSFGPREQQQVCIASNIWPGPIVVLLCYMGKVQLSWELEICEYLLFIWWMQWFQMHEKWTFYCWTTDTLCHYCLDSFDEIGKHGNRKRDHEKFDFCDISCTTLLCLLNSFDELGNMK